MRNKRRRNKMAIGFKGIILVLLIIVVMVVLVLLSRKTEPQVTAIETEIIYDIKTN